MAVRGRGRSVQELYNATELIGKPKITSVLSGSYRMQGPEEETEQDIEKYMLPLQSEKRLGKRSMRRKVLTRGESGTCNVCSAPCSSCMHLKIACMGSKGNGFSDETSRGTASSQNSVNEDDVSPFKDRAYESLQNTASEASNLLSFNSSHDSLYENAESKANIRRSDIVDGSVESEKLLKVDELSPKPQCILDQITFSNKNEYPKVVEGHDDNISCVSRANDMSTAESHHNKCADRKNLSFSSALVSSLGSEGTGKALISPKPELLEAPSDDAPAGSRSPRIQIRCLSSNKNGTLLEEDLKPDSSKVSSQLYPKLEVETRKDRGDQLNKGFKCSNKVEQDEKSNESVELPNIQEAALQSISGDESDESEIVEHDVKVCDICGDTGREDLLAICSKCSDGAEHTYCMREMLQKVPEGDWLCEECKLTEETEKQKLGPDAEGKRSNKATGQISSKRHLESMEVASASKKQAIETSFGSPKSSSPSKTAVLSRDSSFKGLDKGKVKPAHLTSFSNHSTVGTLERTHSSIGPRLQTPNSTLLKSNSFNAVNFKPKVKFVDEVPQKQKGSSSLEMEEGTGSKISKSLSFRSANSRSGATDSKVKMLSSKFSQVQDIKALKQAKERNAFESRTFSKVDRSLGGLGTTSSHISASKINQKLTSHGESAMISSGSNNKELKTAQSDGKLGGLLRSTSIARKVAEIPIVSVRSLPVNGPSSASVEQKLNQVSPKEEPSSSSSWTAEQQSYNVDENLHDGLSRSRESSSQSERTRESSATRSRPAVTAGQKNITCQKCKEVGHTTEFCTIGSPGPSGADTSATRSIKEDVSKGSKLKAAIEAAMLKKPGIFRKKKESESDGMSSSNVDVPSETTYHDQSSVSNKMRNMISDEGTDEGPAHIGTCSSENYRQTSISNVKQPNVNSTDAIFPSRVGEDPMVLSVGKPCRALTPTPIFSKMLSIPEHEYIWQGVVEVRRGGKILDLYGGIQAHLSTFASPKVLEVMNQFPQKITMDEVPRLSTWPRQFHEHGAKEDNIALYFFAKDLESYEKSYKILLEYMIKRDLALKGYFDGVEFLIFPSTLLPENSQRWNMLFFLWGVFRGRKSNCSYSLNKSVISSPHLVPKDMNTSDKPYNSLNGDIDDKVSSLQTNSEQQDGRLGSKPKNATGSALLCSEIRRPTPSEEEVGLSEYKLDAEHKLLTQATGTNSGSNRREERQLHVDASCIREDTSSLKISQAGNQDEGIRESICEEKMVDRMDIDRDEAKAERNLNGDSPIMGAEASIGRDLNVEGLDCWKSNSRKRTCLDLSETAPQTFGSKGQKMPWEIVDRESVSKKLKAGFCEQYACGNVRGGNSVNDGLASQICDLGSSSSIEEKSCDKAPDEKVILVDVAAAERYFFPVDSRRVKDFRLGGNSMPWKEYSSNDEDQFREGVPNLELALGAVTKPPNKGILPFFVGMVEKNNTQIKTSDKVTDKEEEDGVSASLSLSLSFPFPDKEQNVKPVSKTDQLLPERRHVNTSLLLFGGVSDK